MVFGLLFELVGGHSEAKPTDEKGRSANGGEEDQSPASGYAEKIKRSGEQEDAADESRASGCCQGGLGEGCEPSDREQCKRMVHVILRAGFKGGEVGGVCFAFQSVCAKGAERYSQETVGRSQ